MLLLKAKELTFRERLKHLSSHSQCRQHFFLDRDKFVLGSPVLIGESYFWSTSLILSGFHRRSGWFTSTKQTCWFAFLVLVSRYFLHTWMDEWLFSSLYGKWLWQPLRMIIYQSRLRNIQLSLNIPPGSY